MEHGNVDLGRHRSPVPLIAIIGKHHSKQLVCFHVSHLLHPVLSHCDEFAWHGIRNRVVRRRNVRLLLRLPDYGGWCHRNAVRLQRLVRLRDGELFRCEQFHFCHYERTDHRDCAVDHAVSGHYGCGDGRNHIPHGGDQHMGQRWRDVISERLRYHRVHVLLVVGVDWIYNVPFVQ